MEGKPELSDHSCRNDIIKHYLQEYQMPWNYVYAKWWMSEGAARFNVIRKTYRITISMIWNYRSTKFTCNPKSLQNHGFNHQNVKRGRLKISNHVEQQLNIMQSPEEVMKSTKQYICTMHGQVYVCRYACECLGVHASV